MTILLRGFTHAFAAGKSLQPSRGRAFDAGQNEKRSEELQQQLNEATSQLMVQEVAVARSDSAVRLNRSPVSLAKRVNCIS